MQTNINFIDMFNFRYKIDLLDMDYFTENYQSRIGKSLQSLVALFVNLIQSLSFPKSFSSHF